MFHNSFTSPDPNHCAELVCKDLYDSYGQNVRIPFTRSYAPVLYIYIRELVDSLCRDDADMPMPPYNVHMKSLQPPQRCIC